MGNCPGVADMARQPKSGATLKLRMNVVFTLRGMET